MKVIKTSDYKDAKKKKKEWDPNPWAVCFSKIDKDKNPEKAERCIQKVKAKQNKIAQFEEDFSYNEPDDLQEFGDNEAWEDSQADMRDMEERYDSEPSFTIESMPEGGFKVVEHDKYEEGSVLAGKPRDAVVGFFDDVKSAKEEYPTAELLNQQTTPRFTYEDAMNMPEPPDFDPRDAGETW